MRTKAAETCWDEYDDDDGDYEFDRVAMVDGDFERGAALGGLWIRVCSEELCCGRVTAAFAGVTVDLREAALGPNGATIYIQSALSGIQILVPPDWDLVWDVDGICSGISDQRPRLGASDVRPRLRIAGVVVASGLSVR